MSYSAYFVNNVLTAVKEIVDRSQLPQNQPLYQAFLTNVFTQGSPIQNNLFDYLNRSTNGAWQQGLHQQALVDLLRPWIKEAVTYVGNSLQQQMQPQQGFGMGGMYSPFAQQQTPQYAVGGPSPQMPTQQTPWQPPVQTSQTGQFSTDYDLGREVVFQLRKAPSVEVPKASQNGALEFNNYQTGDYEKERLLTIEVSLKIAQNTARDAGVLVYDTAPQEAVRGLFANVIRYQELFHVPIGYQQFKIIAEEVGSAYYSKEKVNWRTAIEALSTRPRAEWSIMNNALCRLLNNTIYRRLRTSTGAVIEGIESLDDLNILDDRNSTLTVTRHASYWSAFNNIVTLAVEHLFDPKALIRPDDKNFGDFIHCEEVQFYSGGRSKYDYGTFQEPVDHSSFVGEMLSTNTVLRIPRAIILTNALDPRLVAKVKAGGPTANMMLVKDINTIGTSLLGHLDWPKGGTIEAIICLEKGTAPDRYLEKINLGNTLDQDLILLK